MSENTKFTQYLKQIHGHVHTKMQKLAAKAHIRRNKIINKHTFQWTFLHNGIKPISLVYRYTLLSDIISKYGKVCGQKKDY